MVLVGVAAAGCSSGSNSGPDRDPNIPAPPKFSGAYAGDFKDAWLDSSNPPFVRTVLQDSKISDQEWAEVGQRLSACLKTKGVTFRGFRLDGSYSVGNGNLSGDEVNALLPKCEQSSGEQAIGYLRNVMTINPNNEPIGQIMAACLIRLHVVAPGYTKDDYLRDAPTQSFPYIDPATGKASYDKCNSNPTTGLGK